MGAGYHGGFGTTNGFRMAYKIGFLSNGYKEYTRNEIFDYLKGVTTISTKIITEIEEGTIGINVIGDELFNRYFTGGYKCAGMQVSNQIYIKRSATDFYSTIVHEGNHALEYINHIPQKDISSKSGEKRAFLAEHNFQKAKKIRIQFKSEKEIEDFIDKNYQDEV